MRFTVIQLNAAPAAAKLEVLLFPVIQILLTLLFLIVVSVIAYMWFKDKPIGLK